VQCLALELPAALLASFQPKRRLRDRFGFDA
jgi:hypothetical protein